MLTAFDKNQESTSKSGEDEIAKIHGPFQNIKRLQNRSGPGYQSFPESMLATTSHVKEGSCNKIQPLSKETRFNQVRLLWSKSRLFSMTNSFNSCVIVAEFIISVKKMKAHSYTVARRRFLFFHRVSTRSRSQSGANSIAEENLAGRRWSRINRASLGSWLTHCHR
jgi:hypothetical protein